MFLREATPFYESPGGIEVRLLQDVNDPDRFIELVLYDDEATYMRDQHRVEHDPTMRQFLARWRDLLAEPPVAVVDKVVDKRGTRQVAEAYLDYLYSEEGQEIAAKHFYRPSNEKVSKKYIKQFPQIELFKIDDAFGGWKNAHKTHFADGGTFDQIYLKQ